MGYLGITKLTQGTLTGELTEVLLQWNLSGKHRALNFLGPRLVGSVATPCTCIIDAVAHGVLFAQEMAALAFVASYNILASRIKVNYIAIKEFEPSLTLKHIIKIIESLFHAALLPFLMLLDPKQGYQRVHFQQQVEEKQKEALDLKKQKIIAEQRVHLFDDFLSSLEKKLNLPAPTKEKQELTSRFEAILGTLDQPMAEKKKNKLEDPDFEASLIELEKQFQSMTEKEKNLKLSDEQKQLLENLKFDLSPFQQEPTASEWRSFLAKKSLTPKRVYRESIALRLWCIFGELSDKITKSRYAQHLQLHNDWIMHNKF